MTKSRLPEPEASSSRAAMIVLVAGFVVVGGLVVWALTRTVEVSRPIPAAETTTTAELDTSALSATAARNTPPLADTASIPTNSAAPPPPPPPEVHGDRHEVARIAPEDLQPKWKRGEVTIIDVRDEASYKSSHIPGALHIAFASIQGQIDQIPKGKPVVLYCT